MKEQAVGSIPTIGFESFDLLMKVSVEKFDTLVLGRFRHLEVLLARLALFVVYFWFGALKAGGMSPAGPLVHELYLRTASVIPFPTFYGMLAVFEMAIGILFLLRGMERFAILLVSAHMIMVALPLFVLPTTTWDGFLVPTLEGQYVIKNILIVALAVVVGAHARWVGHNDRTAEAL